MKSKILFPLLILPAVILIFSSGCSDESSPTESATENEIIDTTQGPVVRKPNLYLYPKTKCSVSVKLEFPYGGSIIESIPEYSGQWQVEADPSGKINNQYDYLFYECRTPDLYQYNYGWIVERDSLLKFFEQNLTESGFSENEIRDFTEYWIPRLLDYPFYVIYPQYSSDIEKLIRLNISPRPDNLIRFFYLIKGSQNKETILSEPLIQKAKREGFVAAEWGVVLK